MQLTALREAKAAYYFSVATQQLNEMTERLQTLAGENYTEQLAVWNRQNQVVLPQGRGMIQRSDSVLIVSIFWGEKEKPVCDKNKIEQSGCLRMVLKI